MNLPDDFYLGGVLAANQCEGAYNENGKGLSTADTLGVGYQGRFDETYGQKSKLSNIILAIRQWDVQSS